MIFNGTWWWLPSGKHTKTYGKSPCSIGTSTRYGHVQQQTVSLPGYSMSMIYVNIARSTIRLLYFETFHRMIAAYMWGHVRRYPWCTYIRDIWGRRIDLYPSASSPRLIMKKNKHEPLGWNMLKLISWAGYLQVFGCYKPFCDWSWDVPQLARGSSTNGPSNFPNLRSSSIIVPWFFKHPILVIPININYCIPPCT